MNTGAEDANRHGIRYRELAPKGIDPGVYMVRGADGDRYEIQARAGSCFWLAYGTFALPQIARLLVGQVENSCQEKLISPHELCSNDVDFVPGQG